MPQCIARPQQTEGPYFVDEKLNRSDIRSDPASGRVCDGAPLDLVFNIMAADGSQCRPIKGAMVDVWQCDALGVYSDVHDQQNRFDTRGQKFLRGHQVTNAEGTARFTTIYPGWYEGRTVHIHFKVRAPAARGSTHEFTSQLYFDDALTDKVMKTSPYAQKGERTTRNSQEGIFRRGGDQLLLDVKASEQGYRAEFSVGLAI